ncbi:hypothetical protein D3C87_1034700 [compost metagenome]
MGLQTGDGFGGAGMHDDVAASQGQRVAGKATQGLGLRNLDEVREGCAKHRDALGVEGLGNVHGRRLVDQAQAGVQVVELVGDEAQRHDRHAEHLRDDVIGRAIGPVAVAAPDELLTVVPERVPLTFQQHLRVGKREDPVAVGFEPSPEMRDFLLAGRMLHVAEHDVRLIVGIQARQGLVRREDHVLAVLGAGNHFHREAKPLEGGLQGLPLGLGLGEVDRPGVAFHIGVLDVDHAEVIGSAHERLAGLPTRGQRGEIQRR